MMRIFRPKILLLTLVGTASLAAIMLYVNQYLYKTKADSPVYIVPSSIEADCLKPVDPEINAFIKSVPDGSTIQFPQNGCFGQSAQIEVNDRNNLTFEGNDSTFKILSVTNQCQANWRIQGSTNIVIKKMTARGTFTTGFDGPRPPSPDAQCAHGFSFDSTQGGAILDSQAYDIMSDPVSFEPDIRKGDYCAVPPARNILVDNFKAVNAGRTVGITDGEGITIQNSYFGDMFDNGADLEADVSCEWMRNIKFINNHFGRYHYAMVNMWTDIVQLDHTGNIEIRGNVTDTEPVSCYAPVNFSPGNNPNTVWVPNVSVVGNDLKTLGQGINAYNVANAYIENNNLYNDYGTGCNGPAFPKNYGVFLQYDKGVNVYGNTLIAGAPGTGFPGGELYNGEGNTDITQNPPNITSPTPTPTTVILHQTDPIPTLTPTPTPTQTANKTPVIGNVSISPSVVNPNGSNQYTITVTATDPNGGSDITAEYAVINYQGTNAGTYRGYIGWSANQNFYAWNAFKSPPISCGGGGYMGVIKGYGDNFINLLSCTNFVSANTRTTSFVVTFDPAFTSPISNTLSGFTMDTAGAYDGWKPFSDFTVSTTPVTPTFSQGSTSLSLTLLLHGLGKGGDSSNPNSGGTTNPQRVQRNVTVELFNSANQLVQTKSGIVYFDSSTGSFSGNVDLGNTLSSGVYTVKVKVDQFLKRLVPGIQNITAGTVNQLPQTSLISGDMNNDNKIDVLDYNILIDCYSDLTPAKNCSDSVKKQSADLTDDGLVNQFDYNLFLREMTNIPGQ